MVEHQYLLNLSLYEEIMYFALYEATIKLRLTVCRCYAVKVTLVIT